MRSEGMESSDVVAAAVSKNLTTTTATPDVAAIETTSDYENAHHNNEDDIMASSTMMNLDGHTASDGAENSQNNNNNDEEEGNSNTITATATPPPSTTSKVHQDMMEQFTSSCMTTTTTTLLKVNPKNETADQNSNEDVDELDTTCPICLEEYTTKATIHFSNDNNDNNNDNMAMNHNTCSPNVNINVADDENYVSNFVVLTTEQSGRHDEQNNNHGNESVVERVRLMWPPYRSELATSHNNGTTHNNSLPGTEVASASSSLTEPQLCIGNNEDDSNNNDVVIGCQHCFCRDCLRDHCRYAIQSRDVPIACPRSSDVDEPCRQMIPSPIVEFIFMGQQQQRQQQHSTDDQIERGECQNDNPAVDETTTTTLDHHPLSVPLADGSNDEDDVLLSPLIDEEIERGQCHCDGSNDGDDALNNTTTPTTSLAAFSEDLQLWKRYQKLERLKQDSRLIECPCCDHLVMMPAAPTTPPTTPTTIQSYNSANDLNCSVCQTTFCRIHGTAHPHVSCAEFMSSPPPPRGTSDVLTEHTLASWTKPCSHCGCRLQKAAGCDHVICPSCRQDMCWKCGTHVHLTGHVVRHCSQCQRDYRDHRYDHIYRFRLALCLPLLLPLFLAYSAVVMAVAAITGCFCGCFRCGRCLELQQRPGAGAAAATATPPPTLVTTNTTTTVPASTATTSVAPSMSHPGSTTTEAQTTTAGVGGTRIPTNSPTASTTTARTTRGSTRLGVWATIVVIFLPVVALLEDFGIHVPILDELFPEPIVNTEMPYLEVEMVNTV